MNIKELKQSKTKLSIAAQDINTKINKKVKLQKQIQKLEAMVNENEALRQYIELTQQLNEVSAEIDKVKKGELYDNMNSEDITLIEGTHCLLSLTKPYMKHNFNLDKFIEDYGPKTAMYKKYVEFKEVKGNVKITIV